MYGLTTIKGYIKTLTPIHHGGDEKTGSETLRIGTALTGASAEEKFVVARLRF